MFLLDEAWVADFERIAGKCFATVAVAPAAPSRRRLFKNQFNPGSTR